MRGAGASRYNGIRVSLAQAPGGGATFITLAVKHHTGGWDEWSLLLPAIRREFDAFNGASEAVEVLHQVLADLLRDGLV